MYYISNPVRTFCGLVDSLLSHAVSPEKLGMVCHLTIQASLRGSHGRDHAYVLPESLRKWKFENRIQRTFAFLFLQPTRYVKVLTQECGYPVCPQALGTGWALQADHDSCWRDSINTLVHDTVFDVMNKLKAEVAKVDPKFAADLYFHHPQMVIEGETESVFCPTPLFVTWDEIFDAQGERVNYPSTSSSQHAGKDYLFHGFKPVSAVQFNLK